MVLFVVYSGLNLLTHKKHNFSCFARPNLDPPLSFNILFNGQKTKIKIDGFWNISCITLFLILDMNIEAKFCKILNKKAKNLKTIFNEYFWCVENL